MVKVHIGSRQAKKVVYDLNQLTRHAAVLGTTGSGKTVMCKVLIEEALLQNIPVIAIDPKGDIGSLGISNTSFDFRPFCKNASKVQAMYLHHLLEQGVDTKKVEQLKKNCTTIYTPKSRSGKSISFLPDLSAPKQFHTIKEDALIIADFVEPVSASLLQLASVKGATKEKAQSLISAILINQWDQGKDLDIKRLIDLIITPPFTEIGSLPLEDFFKETERKKIASQINLLMSSPSKQAWSTGEELSMKKLLAPGKLSVFDLRFTQNIDEKQFIAEQIMQSLYKYLLSKGGTEKLRYILYFDELAGFLPPPPASPPSKKLLELLIRQARAFGLGIILATQNPGDIDYKIFGNMGSRFIGKLRTDNDIEKVASAMDLVPSKIKSDIAGLQTGDFIFNNAIVNKTHIMHARWLYTYHGGPLQEKEIGWVNDSGSLPQQEGKLKVTSSAQKKVKPQKKQISHLLTRVRTEQKKIQHRKSIASSINRSKKESKILPDLLKFVSKEADEVHMKIAVSTATHYTPHLRIVFEARPFHGITYDLLGPWYFDLTSKLIPVGNYLSHLSFRQFSAEDLTIDRPTRSIKQTLAYALSEAQSQLRQTYFQSTLIPFTSVDIDNVTKKNQDHLLKISKKQIDLLQHRNEVLLTPLLERYKTNDQKINTFRNKLGIHKVGRVFKRIIGRKVSAQTQELRHYRKRIQTLSKENARLDRKIKAYRQKAEGKEKEILAKTFHVAKSRIKKLIHRPKKNEFKVHATILLVPKRGVKNL